MNKLPQNKVLIVIPTFNEAENIRQILSAIREVVPAIQILVVDDSSPDGTGDIVQEMIESPEYSDGLRLLRRKAKEGLGPAYIAGFRWALARSFDAVFSMDADFSHDPKYLPPMIAALGDSDVVVGSRYAEGGGTRNWHWSRRIISRMGGVYARLILGVPVADMTAGFNAYRVSVLEQMDFDSFELLGFGFQLEMKYRAHQLGASFLEIPIVFPDRERGVSKMTGSIATEALVKVWQLRLSSRNRK